MCGGGKGTGSGGYAQGLPVAQQSFTQASPEAMGWYRQAMGAAQQAAATPWQNYSTDPSAFVAQLNQQQRGAQQGLAGQAAATQPFANMGAAMQAQAGLGNAAQMAGSYMNPFMQQVVSPVQQALQQQQGQQLAQQQSEAIRSGAFGGERAGLQRQALRGQQELGMGQALSPLYQTGYGQALQAAQTDLARQLQAGQGLSQAGLQAQQASLGAGTLGQQTEQAGLSALYNQFQQARMYPYQQAQFLAGIAGGLGPLLGQTTTQTQATNPFGMFLSTGGAAEDRMGGAVVDAGDYSRGGLAGGGVGGDDLVAEHARMYEGLNKTADTYIPTGQIQAAKGLEPAQFAANQQQKKTGMDKVEQLTNIAKGVGSLFGYGGKDQEGAGALSGLGSLAKTGAKAAANYFLPGSGLVADIAGFENGGVVGYKNGGGPEDDGFAPAVERTLKFEGGFNPSDTNRTPSMYGINQAAHPGIDVRKLTPEQAKDIYRKEYWEGIGASKLPSGVREMAYDTAVMAGPGRARQLLAQSGGDPEKFMEARRGFLNNLLARDPEKYGKYAKAWENRNRALEGTSGGVGAAASGLNADRSSIPMGDPRRSFQATEPGKKEGLSGLLTEENVVPALMGLGSALEGMMTAKTISPGAAVATGLGAGLKEGAKSYMEVPKIKAETIERQNLAERARAEAEHKFAEVPKVEAETKETLAKFYEKQWVPNVGWMVYDKSDPLKTPVPISDAEGNPISGSKISPESIPTRPGGDKTAAPSTTAPKTEAPVAGALDWEPTLKAPANTKIPGALNIAMSGDLPKQQEAAKQYIEQQRTKTDSANAQLYRLDEMERQFKNLPKEGFLTPGAYAGERTEVAKRINELTSILGGAPLFDPNNLAAAETLAKDTTRLGFDVSKSLGHEPGFIVQAATKANPGMENTPMAFNRITAGLKEAAHYEQDKLAFFEDYSARFGTLTGAEKLFRQLNPPSAYANRAILSTIAPEDLSYMKSLTKKQLASGRDKIDKTYGAGVTDLLLGGK